MLQKNKKYIYFTPVINQHCSYIVQVTTGLTLPVFLISGIGNPYNIF